MGFKLCANIFGRETINWFIPKWIKSKINERRLMHISPHFDVTYYLPLVYTFSFHVLCLDHLHYVVCEGLYPSELPHCLQHQGRM